MPSSRSYPFDDWAGIYDQVYAYLTHDLPFYVRQAMALARQGKNEEARAYRQQGEAFDAAVYAVSRYGGQLVAIDGGEGRNYRGIDPNRNFAVTAAEAGPCAMRRPSPRYTKYVMGLFKGQRHILSMHNNTRGGGVSVTMSSAKARGFRTGGRFSDPDHMVFIASKGSIDGDSRDPRLLSRQRAAADRGIRRSVPVAPQRHT